MSTPSISVAQAMQRAQQHQQQGDFAQADAIYRQILRAEPKHADAWYRLGLLSAQTGNHDAAAKLIIQAIGLNEAAPNYRVSLANALLALGQTEPALLCYRQAQQLQPDYAEAYYNMALALQNLGRLDEAIAVYQQALRCKPDLVEAYCNLGAIRQAQQNFDEAAQCYRQALSLRPGFAHAHFNLATLLERQDKPAEAAQAYRAVIRFQPDHAAAHFQLGVILEQQGEFAEAAECYRAAIRLQPDFADAHGNLAAVLQALRRPDEAIQRYREALRLKPDVAERQLNLGTALQIQGKLSEAIACYRETVRLKPASLEAHSNLLFSLLYSPDHDAAEVCAEHIAFGDRFEAPLQLQRIAAHRNHPDPGRRLRIGYNSFDFGNHAIAWFLEPLMANHDHGQLEIYCYANRRSHDSTRQRIAGHADHWRELDGLSDEAAAELIRRDEIDILIDLSGHSAGNRIMIFAHKPAPVQATWLGYLHSSGLRGMDYRITDAHADPAGMTERFHTERLLRLPDSQWCYSARPDCPEPSALPALRNGYLTFGSFHHLQKVTPQVLEVWGRLLAALPNARLVMLAVIPGDTARAIEQAFAAHGVGPERLTLLPALPLYQYLEQYRQVDVALDTFPYNGGTTSCDTLWMGVPLITLAGSHSIARGGVSVLSNLGLQEFIAATPEEYIDIGVGLSRRTDELSAIRAGLRERMLRSPLMDAARFAANMETAYRQMWQQWCASRTE